jgi:hypothetical protein
MTRPQYQETFDSDVVPRKTCYPDCLHRRPALVPGDFANGLDVVAIFF